MQELNNIELENINGGTFGWDAGWLLGNLVAGNFLSPGGTIGAVTDYYIHYN